MNQECTFAIEGYYQDRNNPGKRKWTVWHGGYTDQNDAVRVLEDAIKNVFPPGFKLRVVKVSHEVMHTSD